MALTLAPKPPIALNRLAVTPILSNERQSGVTTFVTGALIAAEITITS